MPKSLSDLTKDVLKAEGRLNEIIRNKEHHQISMEDHQAKADLLTDVLEIAQAVAEARRQQVHERMERLVTKGLKAVFQREDIEFYFETQIKRNNVGMVPMLRTARGEKTLEVQILDAHGGGVADVVAFLLRVVVVSLNRPRSAPVIVLDEGFKHVSPEYLRGVSSLIGELNKTLDLQFIMVTHKSELIDCADIVYRTRMSSGETEFDLQHDLRDEIYHQEPPEELGPEASSKISTFTPYKEGNNNNLGNIPHDAKRVVSETVDKEAIRIRRRCRDESLKKRKKRKKN